MSIYQCTTYSGCPGKSPLQLDHCVERALYNLFMWTHKLHYHGQRSSPLVPSFIPIHFLWPQLYRTYFCQRGLMVSFENWNTRHPWAEQSRNHIPITWKEQKDSHHHAHPFSVTETLQQPGQNTSTLWSLPFPSSEELLWIVPKPSSPSQTFLDNPENSRTTMNH